MAMLYYKAMLCSCGWATAACNSCGLGSGSHQAANVVQDAGI